jgi:23S rRNA pseudouridine2605 synthase
VARYSLRKQGYRAGKHPSLNMTKDLFQRLQKVLAHAGVASRRQSEELIRQGRVTVNGRVVTELGTKVDPAHDDIRVDGQRIQVAASHVYLMLNKPRGVLSTMEDARGRRALGDLVQAPVRLYPVGRLDASSEGLILLTDDGELANLLTHPRFEHEKEYRAFVNGRPSEEILAAWRRGIVLDGKPTAPAQVDVIRQEKGSTHLRIVIHEGRKRQIRRIAALLGHPVRELKRVRLGPLELGTLETGQWRYLTVKEIRELGGIKRSFQKMERRRKAKGSKNWR